MIENKAAGIREFLDRCDEVLVEKVGEPGLAQYLEGAPVSPKQFLQAQKASFLGVRL